MKDVLVIAPNLHRRWSGVTSTIAALVPVQAEALAIAATGPGLPAHVPQLSFARVVAGGWSRPPGRPARIWHARRNDEMIVGLLLRHVLRQPWRLVFTSAAQRRHTRFTRWLLRRMDAVIATSPAAASYLEVPHTVVPHGVDLGRFHPAADRAAAWRASGLPGARGIGVFGRIRANKGTDVFVEAMLRLLPAHQDVTAVVTGAADDAVFLEQLRARVAAAGLAGRVLFLGERPSSEMPEWFRRVAVYVAPMRWEGFGLTPLEAMASGAAVVATRTGAAPLLVEHGVTGTLVPPDDADALTAAIAPLLADAALAERMGAAGLAKARAQHSIRAEAAAIRAVYERVWAG